MPPKKTSLAVAPAAPAAIVKKTDAKKAPAGGVKKTAAKRVSFGDVAVPARPAKGAAPANRPPVAALSQVVIPRPAIASRAPKVKPAAKAAPPPKKRVRVEAPSKDDEDDDDDSSSDDDSDEESDLMTSDDDDDDSLVGEGKEGAKKSARPSYAAVQLRYLPPAFQEPQLCKFLSQFGTKVLGCFCVRQKRTHQPKGIAYVHLEDESVLPIVIEEMNGMSLGGRTVRARVVQLHRPMPERKVVRSRRLEGRSHQAYGAKMTRFTSESKDPVAALIKYSRSEQKHNATLAKMGIAYQFNGFAEQLKKVPKSLIKPSKVLAEERVEKQKAKIADKANGKAARVAKLHQKKERQAAAKKASPQSKKGKAAQQKGKAAPKKK